MVSALISGSRGLGSRPGWIDVVFLGKTLYSHSAFLPPGVQMGTGALSGKSDEMLGGNLAIT